MYRFRSTSLAPRRNRNARLQHLPNSLRYVTQWKNKGSMIYADGLLYIFEEKTGHIGLLEPTPEGFKLISSFLPDGGTGPWWAHMTIYGKKLFMRHGPTLFVYDIAEKI